MSQIDHEVADDLAPFRGDAKLRNIILDGIRRQTGQVMIFHEGPYLGDLFALGFSPLINPITGARYGDEAFNPYWDALHDHGGWFELTVSFAQVPFGCLFKDDHMLDQEVRQMCRDYACQAELWKTENLEDCAGGSGTEQS